MDINSATNAFRKMYNGPRIAFLISGGGYSCLNFRQLPGASRILDQAVEPYSSNSFADFLNSNLDVNLYDDNSRFCDESILDEAVYALENYVNNSEVLCVVVTSALTTDRFRRGDNRALIAFSDGRRFRLSLPKLEEQFHNYLTQNNQSILDKIRLEEDNILGQVVLSLIMNDPSFMPSLNNGSSLEILPAKV